jgi:hypothetical protein
MERSKNDLGRLFAAIASSAVSAVRSPQHFARDA